MLFISGLTGLISFVSIMGQAFMASLNMVMKGFGLVAVKKIIRYLL